MKNKIVIFLFISSAFSAQLILATEEEDNDSCASAVSSPTLIKNNSQTTDLTEKINYPKRIAPSTMGNNFPQFSLGIKLQHIKSALRYEVGVDISAELKKAKSEEEFLDLRLPIGFSGREFVDRYDVILGWIIDQLSHQNQNVHLQILRAIYKMIFKLDANVDVIYPELPSPIIKQHFDSILRFLLQYQNIDFLSSNSELFQSEQPQQNTERKKVEERIQIITQLWEN